MGIPHILVVPYPAQGHVIPFMELSQNLAKQGFRISFVNSEFNHKRILDAFGKKVDENGLIHLVSLPDGLEDGEDRNQLGKFTETLCQVMPRGLKEFIEKVNRSEDDKITCVLADVFLIFELEVAAELGIRRSVLCPPSVLQLKLLLHIPKLIDENGTPVNQHMMLQLSPTTPAIHPINFLWLNFDNGDPTAQKFIFHFLKGVTKVFETADWVLCNSSLELKPEGFTLVPKVLPIGPLSASNRLGNLSGNFWPVDTNCLQWLDQQPPGSVIYVAFGSMFLIKYNSKNWLSGWNSPTGDSFGFGWNSTIEGVSNGVLFLCRPAFADQFLNESYICDIWKTGLKFERDGRGIITKK
ncbi:hypothetical protein DITRI_Ditri09bG0055700 [Diplodiscus trichospermus]